VISRNITLPGTFLKEVDALSQSMVDSTIRRVDNLPALYDWKIDEFKVDFESVTAGAMDSDNLSAIEDSFRSSIKFVADTLGDELSTIIDPNEDLQNNIFPAFPSRVVNDHFLEKAKVQQFVKIKVVDDV
jgi:hypothetical protein